MAESPVVPIDDVVDAIRATAATAVVVVAAWFGGAAIADEAPAAGDPAPQVAPATAHCGVVPTHVTGC